MAAHDLEARVISTLHLQECNGDAPLKRCVHRICSELPADASPDEILSAARRMPYVMRAMLEQARVSGAPHRADDEDDGYFDGMAAPLSGGMTVEWPACLGDRLVEEAQQAYAARVRALHAQLEAFHRQRRQAEIGGALGQVLAQLQAMPQHEEEAPQGLLLPQARVALQQEAVKLSDAAADAWAPILASAAHAMREHAAKAAAAAAEVRSEDIAAAWRRELGARMSAERRAALTAVHRAVEAAAPSWQAELRGLAQRVAQLL